MNNETRSNKEVTHLVEELPDNIQEITQTLRTLVLETSPKLIEEYKWSMPNYSYKGLVCYLQPAKKHVNLGFQRGNELEEKDIHNLLQGSGKTMRHIRIKKMEDIQPKIFTFLIHAAIKLNEK
ncbi:DUF1801 domain-containing protein [Desemzia sp. RIT804]|uniref:DUF1801 domain-containing protein n=1 Tax=Desemzia sp. RIT 804 TaxID=2810209 RepID=UPI0019507941|nr:DUF1801 domain-containing protein [Desemzia sp. RIT 804]MBM6614619.1 DUF1801 domain-containing protein [Desemzia sp. RIT 804]